MMNKSEKIPILSDASLFTKHEKDGGNIQEPTSSLEVNNFNVFFDVIGHKTLWLSSALVLLATVRMVGLPVWASSLACNDSDVFAVAVCYPILSTIIFVSMAMFRWKSEHFKTTVSMYPFYIKEVICYGILTSFGLILQAFCGLPSRTPAYLQAPAFITAIIIAAIARGIAKGRAFSRKEMGCILGVVVMVAVNFFHFAHTPGYSWRPSSQSNMANNTGDISDHCTNPVDSREWSASEQSLWTFGFTIGQALLGVAFFFLEDCLVEKGAHPLVVSMYAQILTMCSIVFLFFFDVIPGFGMASDLDGFRHNLHRAAGCLFGVGSGCTEIAWRGWLYLISAIATFLVQIYLISISGSQLFTIAAVSAGVPIASLVWMCIGDNGLGLFWFPTFSATSIFVFLSLLLTFPLAVVSHFYSIMTREKIEYF